MMDDADGRRAATVALLVLGMLSGLACAAVLGAVTALVVIEMDRQGPAVALPQDAAADGSAGYRGMVFRARRAPQEGECAVVIWNTGMIYCVRDKAAHAVGEKRPSPAVVVQAQAGE